MAWRSSGASGDTCDDLAIEGCVRREGRVIYKETVTEDERRLSWGCLTLYMEDRVMVSMILARPQKLK